MTQQHETKKCYYYDGAGWLTGVDIVEPDPETPGEWLLPPNSTLVQPPEYNQRSPMLPCWNGEVWELKHCEPRLKSHEHSVRIFRDLKLRECDWTMLPDVHVGNRKDWCIYRQELRDLPTHPDWPYVAFPTPPNKKEVANG